jgi:integrase
VTSDLEPLAPTEAFEMYLKKRRSDLADESYRKQKQRLRSFLDFCEDEDIDNLNHLTGRDLYRFRIWREQGNEDYEPVKPITVRANLATLRTFLGFCENIDAVPPGMKQKLELPDVESETNDELLEPDRAEEILEHLERYEYASRAHVTFAILWETAARLGGVRTLDVGDFDPEASCLEIRHRPETDTPIKNKEDGERDVYVDEFYAAVIEDYIEVNRHDVTDEHGREPLLTTEHGRATTSTLRKDCYRYTLPCTIGSCPHGRDPDTCEWVKRDQLSGCPSARSPHRLRTGSITDHRNRGVPAELASDRVDATIETIERYYDKRSKRERMKTRRKVMRER